jgi:Tol biopolymer transport system component
VAVRRIFEDRQATLFEGIATALAAWIVLGAYLVSWALQTGQTQNATFSIYHVPAYLGLIALVVVVLERIFDRSAGGGIRGRIRSAWAARSPGERLIVVGTLFVLGYVLGDVIWQAVTPIGSGLEARQAPTRLLLLIGLGLVASGWILAAALAGTRVGWLGVLGFTTILAIANFWIGGWHPIAVDRAARPAVSAADPTSEIWTMAADGSLQTRVVRVDGANLSQPAFSPDGRQIVYVRWPTAPVKWQEADLWIVGADGSNAHLLAHDTELDWIPAWSPDGAWIAFTSRAAQAQPAAAQVAQPQPGGPPVVLANDAGGWRTYLIRANGSDRHALTTGGQALAPVWSPDGQRLAYHGTRDGNLDVFVANADGTGEQRITDDPAADWSPAWSPDGTKLAFTSNRSGNDDVWIVGVDGDGATDLTNNPAADQVPVWSPDGARIAFVSDRTGDVEVWSMARDGSDLRNLTQSPSTNDGQWSVGWSHDGTRLVYARSTDPPIDSVPVVREDLGLAGMLLAILALVLIVLAVDGVGGVPFGGFTAMIGASTLLVAAVSDGWLLLPAGIAAGIIGDLVARGEPRTIRRIALASLVPATFVFADLAILAATADLGWSASLAAGAVLASGLLGLTVAIATTIQVRRPDGHR